MTKLSLQCATLQIAIHILKFRNRSQLLLHDRRKREQVLQVVALECVLELRVAGTPADLNILLRLHEEHRSRNASHLGAQPIDDLGDADLALGERLQTDTEVSGIRSIDKARYSFDGWIGFDNRHVIEQLLPHGLKRRVLAGPGVAIDAARVLLRKEAFGDHDIEINRQAHRSQRDAKHQRLVSQYPSETARISVVQSL